MTYSQALDNAIAMFSQGGQIDSEDYATVEKLQALKAQLEKRHSGSSKPTKTQVENEAIKANILSVLTDEGQTASEILAQVDGSLSSKPLTNQRVSALLRQLIADGKAVKAIEKKVSYFSLA